MKLSKSLFSGSGIVPFNSRGGITCSGMGQSHWLLATHAWKQTSGDPSGQIWNCRGTTLLYNFTTALLYITSSVTMARIVAVLLNIY